MAQRGSNKQRAIEHEEHIARRYGGKRSASSGAAETDPGDVRTKRLLIECKTTGGPGRDKNPTPVLLARMEKIAQEAWAEGRDPAIALRYYSPTSPLSNHAGWVDLIVRHINDDVQREARM